MKSKHFLWITNSLVALTLSTQSCTQDENQVLTQLPNAGNTINVKASFEGQEADTRITLDASYNVLWSENDAFALFYNDGIKNTNSFTLTEGQGTTSGTFSGTAETGKTPAYAVYPADQANSVADGYLVMTLPAEITNYTGTSNGPMLGKNFFDATHSTWGNISFKHLAAMLKLTINKFPQEATTLEISASNEIAGSFKANLADEDPVLVYSGSGGGKTVKAVFAVETAANVSKSFYFPIPAGTYTSITAKLTNNSKTFFEKTLTNTVTLNRRDILVVPPFDYVEVTGSTPLDVTSSISSSSLPTSELQAEQTTTVSIPETVAVTSGNQSIDVPVVTKSNIALTFGAVPTGTSTTIPLKINESSTTLNNGNQNEVSIAIPQVSDQSQAPHISLNLTKSTVILEATNTTATYGTVEASTAPNTLVIKEGVTVKHLIIGQGNVKVYGTVEKISRSSSNPDNITEVRSYGKADIQSADETSMAKMKFCSTWDGTSKVQVPESGQIFTAAQLASLQSAQSNNSATASGLSPTVTKDISLCTNVDLQNHPWLGMVISNNTFDGQNKVISNLTMNKNILKEQNSAQFIPEACIGFFAAAYTDAVIKNVKLEDVTIHPKLAVKWVGALVGYSTTTKTYESCSVTRLDVVNTGTNAIRVGGLIGFIGAGSPTLNNCSVSDASLKAKSAIGGLVGTVQCSTTFNSCKTENITIIHVNPEGAGYASVSRFIGNPQIGAGTTITIKDCASAPFTPEERVALDFSKVIKVEGTKSYYYDDGNQWVGISMDGFFTLSVDDNEKTAGVDYNVFKEKSSDTSSTPDYTEEDKNWD